MWNELAADVHADNVTAGWWTNRLTGESILDTRNIAEMLALTHSEVSEAQEGYKDDLMDDKLPDRPMQEVEIADVMIRNLDLCGAKGVDIDGYLDDLTFDNPLDLHDNFIEDCAELHYRIDKYALEGYRRGKTNTEYLISEFHYGLILIHATCLQIADKHNLDVEGAMAEKRAFNKTREDHKLENRLKEGGKII